MFLASKRAKDNWQDLDGVDAVSWLKKGSGRKAYDILWDRLFRLKFHDFTDNLSAAWIWARIRRVGQSRRSIFQESLGYLEGGSETLLNELAARIEQQGGRIHLSTPVQKVRIENHRVSGVELNSGFEACDQVISTIPLQYIPRLIPDLPEEQLERYRNVQNIGVVCLIYKLKKPVTDKFWLNISDPEFDIPGIIEMSNLRPLPDHLVYVPYYMPQSHPRFSWSDERIINEATGYLKKLNPELTDADIIAVNASRYAYAQPICQPGFSELLPPVRGTIDNLLIADTSYYYPEDRSIAESVQLGRQLARMAQTENQP